MNNWKKVDDDYVATATNDSTDNKVILKEYTVFDLWQQAWSKAGKSLFYMQFLRSNINWDDGGQQTRVERMCYHLAAEWNPHLKDTPENRKWFRDWIEKFDDEVENQC